MVKLPPFSPLTRSATVSLNSVLSSSIGEKQDLAAEEVLFGEMGRDGKVWFVQSLAPWRRRVARGCSSLIDLFALRGMLALISTSACRLRRTVFLGSGGSPLMGVLSST